MRHRRSGLEELRLISSNFDLCRADVLDAFSSVELVAIGRALLACGWDVLPDQWSPRQLREAVAGVVPRFREDPRGLVPVHVGHDGAEFDGHCMHCDRLVETDHACACECPAAAGPQCERRSIYGSDHRSQAPSGGACAGGAA